MPSARSLVKVPPLAVRESRSRASSQGTPVAQLWLAQRSRGRETGPLGTQLLPRVFELLAASLRS